MSFLYCDAVIEVFTMPAGPLPDGMGPHEFANMKGEIQRGLIGTEELGRLIRAWSRLTVAVDARTLETRGLDSPNVPGGVEEILQHAVAEMNRARRRKPDLRLGPAEDGLPPGPMCVVRGPVHRDIHMRMIHLGDRPWILTSGRLSLAIGILLDVTLPLYPFDLRP